MKRRRVDFLVVGAMRCGSTTLRELLDRHPEVSLPQRELYFFSFHSTYERGGGWYEKCVAHLTRPVRIVGEKCVSYGFTPEARERMWRYSPELRLVWILRDPVHRAYSHYLHNVNNGIETRPFVEAIEDEYAGRTTARFKMYLARGRYVSEIRHFLERFPINQVHVITLEQLAATPREVLGRLFRFLGADSGGYRYRAVALNRCYRAAFPRLVGWCATTFGYYSPPHRATRLLRSPLQHFPLDPVLQRALGCHFYMDNEDLQQLMGLDLSRWEHPTS